jgi:hypothetical protein
VDDFRQFDSALEYGAVVITKENDGSLSLLYDHFSLAGLAARLSEFRWSSDWDEVLTVEDREARLRPSAPALPRSQLSRLPKMQESAGEAAVAALGRLSQVEAEVA